MSYVIRRCKKGNKFNTQNTTTKYFSKRKIVLEIVIISTLRFYIGSYRGNLIINKKTVKFHFPISPHTINYNKKNK